MIFAKALFFIKKHYKKIPMIFTKIVREIYS